MSSRAVRAVARRTGLDQRRAPLVWGGPLAAMSALMVVIYPSIQDSLQKAVDSYPQGIKEAFRVENLDTVAAYLDTEMFSLIIPIAIGVFAVRCITRVTVSAEGAGFLDVVLSTPLRRRELITGGFLATSLSLALVLAVVGAVAWVASVIVGAGLALSSAAAGVASVWPLGLFFAGFAAALAGVTHESSVVTGAACGVLVAMYVVDLVGKLSDSLSWIRYGSVFRYYGNALRDGIDPLAFVGVAGAGLLLAVAGAALFERRDISA